MLTELVALVFMIMIISFLYLYFVIRKINKLVCFLRNKLDFILGYTESDVSVKSEVKKKAGPIKKDEESSVIAGIIYMENE